MSVNLRKGQKINLSKEQPGLSRIIVGLGWDAAKRFNQEDIDCDATAILLGNGFQSTVKDIVYFGNLTHYSYAVRHMGDNLTGDGEGDDEQIVIDLNSIPPQYDKIIICVNIYKANQRRQHFGMIENAFIRVVNAVNNREICIYNLSENYYGCTAMIFGEVNKINGVWNFNAIGEGTKDNSIAEIAQRYGIDCKENFNIGCYIATSVYGSYDCPEVWTLRRYRDNILAKTFYGRAFIKLYYKFSPILVKWFGNTSWFKSLWKSRLDAIVNTLNEKGIKNTPYRDKNWN